GWAPRPRKDSPLADKTAVAILNVAWTMIGDDTFGKICLKIMRKSLAPNARTASIYSNCLTSNVEPLTIRAKTGTEEIATAIMTLYKCHPSTLHHSKAMI